MLASSPISALLLVVNILTTCYVLFMDPRALDRLALKPYRVKQDQEAYRLLTSGLVHVNMGHLLVNMVTLFFFGPALEYQLGPIGFLVLYLGSDLASGALSMIKHHDDAWYSSVGASGAISGVVIAYALFYPLRPIYMMFIPIGIPAIVFAGLYIGFSAWAAKDQRPGSIAHIAHLGGALGGLLITVILEPSILTHFIRMLTY